MLAAGGGAFHLLLTLLFMLIALFFVYRDGFSFSKQIDMLGERILPNRWERISRVVPATISSTVMGMTLIAIGEGIVLGLAYWIAGVPSPVTLGVLTGVMALIPGGAPLSFSLVSIYLLASGSHVAGIGLFVWGTVELFIVDKTLRPKLVGGPIKLPFLPTFFGLVGGVKTMGFLGLFIGPVLMALIVAIWREWIHEARNADKSETGPQIIIDEQAPPPVPVRRKPCRASPKAEHGFADRLAQPFFHEQAERVRQIAAEGLDFPISEIAVESDRLGLVDAGFEPDCRQPLSPAIASSAFIRPLAILSPLASGSTNMRLISAVPSPASTSAQQPTIASPLRATRKLTEGFSSTERSTRWLLSAG